MLIGLGHQATVGKDTVGDILVAEHGFTKVSFAAALKELALELNPKIYFAQAINVGVGKGSLKHLVQQDGWDKAKAGFPEVRRFLQDLGVAMRKFVGPNVWIDRVLPDDLMGMVDYVDRHVVVTDVRFRNEFDRIHDLGGYCVKVERPGVGAANGHISEHELADAEWDYVLQNNGSIDDLGFEVARMLDRLAPITREDLDA